MGKLQGHDLLKDLLPPNSMWSWIFNALDVCGEEMEAQGVTTDKALPMMALAPHESFFRKDLRIYRAHVSELCKRWKSSRKLGDLDYRTDAEILLVLCNTSLLAPLTPTGAAVYSRLFRSIFGDAVPELADLDRESWDGQVEEELSRLRSKKVTRKKA